MIITFKQSAKWSEDGCHVRSARVGESLPVNDYFAKLFLSRGVATMPGNTGEVKPATVPETKPAAPLQTKPAHEFDKAETREIHRPGKWKKGGR